MVINNPTSQRIFFHPVEHFTAVAEGIIIKSLYLLLISRLIGSILDRGFPNQWVSYSGAGMVVRGPFISIMDLPKMSTALPELRRHLLNWLYSILGWIVLIYGIGKMQKLGRFEEALAWLPRYGVLCTWP
jgi:hypothetical protein